jgi:N-acetylglucosamine kinase-like BadF-type ATPase
VRFDGVVLARGEAGPSNVYELGIDQSRRVIAEAAHVAWREAGLPGEKPCAFLAIFGGVAGAGGPEEQRALASALAAEFGVAPGSTRVDHDLRIALAGALAGEPGVVLLAGTGAAAYGRGVKGDAGKAGGWGALLDDGGGGTWIGLQAMRLVVRVADGRAQPTPLAEAVLGQLNAANPRELLHRLQPAHAAPLQRAAIAALAPLVIVAAATGDAAANTILHRGAQELAEMARAVTHRIDHGSSGRLRLAAAGGLLENSEGYFELVAAAVGEKLPGVVLERAQLPPAAGAALLALELAGQPRTPEIVERLRAEPAGVT